MWFNVRTTCGKGQNAVCGNPMVRTTQKYRMKERGNRMKRKVLFLSAVMSMVLAAAGCGAGKNQVKTDYVDDLSKYVTLGEYKGLEYEEESSEVTEEEIDSEVQYLLQSQADTEHIMEGTVAEGDTVNIDYTGMKDGVEFEGGKDTGYDLTIGSGAFIEGFEDQLIGMKVGETRQIDVTFPESYSLNPDLAGQPVVFEVTVNYICGETILPELTDEFVAEYTDYDTVEEYRSYVKDYLADYKESSVESNRQQSLWQQVMDNSEILQIPEDKVDEEVENMYTSYEQYAGYYGMEMSDFLEQMGMTEDDFRKEMTSYAEELVKRELVFNAIIEKEGISIGDDEYTKQAEEMAAEYGYESVEAMEEAVGQDAVKEDMLWDKVLDVIVSSAKVKE